VVVGDLGEEEVVRHVAVRDVVAQPCFGALTCGVMRGFR
jgi:hypothetical protein